MATIRQRKNRDGSKSWQVQIRRKGHAPISRTFDSKRDAEQWSRGQERSMDLGEYKDLKVAQGLSLADALDRYVETRERSGKPLSAQSMRMVSKWKRHRLASVSLAHLTAADLAQWRDERLAEGRSASTIRNEISHISNVFNLARREWSIGRINNPVEDVNWPSSMGNARDRRLEVGEEKTILEQCDATVENIWIKPMIVLALETAARRGELLSVVWEDVELEKREMTFRSTKNGDDRTIPLSTKAVSQLQGLPTAEIKKGQVIECTEDAFIKCWQRLQKQLAKKGVKNLRFHDLRHEATSRLFEKGFGLMEAAHVTGHRDLQMLKRYTHIRPQSLLDKIG
ncbi:tyrosine-type recombinase/integrase [Kordiimonas gwangyangensis]|uniref:tyrosine-type recombinase/integrase n=1 Tax=Kordiimonas gwangyangensis TaxID=288022 RepID=UPI00036E4B28|nr:site-specific integrase [Kordiimonas gwangyangensis]